MIGSLKGKMREMGEKGEETLEVFLLGDWMCRRDEDTGLNYNDSPSSVIFSFN